MYAVGQSAAQEVQSAKVVIVLAAIAIVAFWRVLLRLLLALVAIGLVVLLGAGAVVMLQR
jgi:hypothetical protein